MEIIKKDVDGLLEPANQNLAMKIPKRNFSEIDENICFFEWHVNVPIKVKQFFSSDFHPLNHNEKIQISLQLWSDGFTSYQTNVTNKTIFQQQYFLHVMTKFDGYMELRFKFEISIFDADKKEFGKKSWTETFLESDRIKKAFGFSVALKHNFVKKENQIVAINCKNHSVTIQCRASLEHSKPEMKKIKNLSFCEKLFEEGTYSDITLVVDDKEIKAHKGMLSISSPVLASMFLHEKENKIAKIVKIVIREFSFQVVREMVRFMYTSRVQNISAIASELIYAAKKYDIVELFNQCEESLLKSATFQNAVALFTVAEDCKASKLRNKVVGIIESDLSKVRNISTAANRLIYTAKKHGLNELFIQCEEKLCKTATFENAVALFAIAGDCEAKKLKNKVVKILANDLKRLTNDPGYGRLQTTQPGLLSDILKHISVSFTII